MFTGLRILCFSLVVLSVTTANAQFGPGFGHGGPRPPGWGHGGGRPGRPMPIPIPIPVPVPVPAPMPPPPPPPPMPMGVNVYRFYSPYAFDHLMTLNPQEGMNAGYQYEGVAFSLYNDDGRGMRVPLFRCFIPGQAHFVSNDWNCQGQVREGLLGFADRQPSGWSPREIVHCSNGRDHLATANRVECMNVNYPIYEILGYVR